MGLAVFMFDVICEIDVLYLTYVEILLIFLYNSIVILLLDRRYYAYFINK